MDVHFPAGLPHVGQGFVEELRNGGTHGAYRKPAGLTFTKVWAALLGLTGIEVFLAYEQVGVWIMLVALLGLSVVKAALIIAYFMHLNSSA